jgi:hypothetical protein
MAWNFPEPTLMISWWSVSKDSFENHFVRLEEVFTRLPSAELKVNASKSHFCCDELEYLGYLI